MMGGWGAAEDKSVGQLRSLCFFGSLRCYWTQAYRLQGFTRDYPERVLCASVGCALLRYRSCRGHLENLGRL